MSEGGINQLVLPDEVRDALFGVRVLREREGSIESTIDAVWQYTL
jgi:hypothetical protein